jgi:uncharacterized protein (TIGR03435 family)
MRASAVFAMLTGAIAIAAAARAELLQESGGQRLTFEVASVKPDPPSAVRHVLLPPVGNRFSTRLAPLGLLIQSAYGVNSFEIVGGPDWMSSAGFDIEAKAAGNPTSSQMWLMLRSLLEDRFALKVHRETKVMPVYNISVAKSGLRLPKSAEEDCVDAAPVQGQKPPGPCGRVTVAFERAAGLDLEGRHVTLAELTRALAAIFQRSVLDQSGLSGRFDINLRFAYEPDVTVGIGNPWSQGNSGVAEDPGINPSITVALQQQLGLSLESTKGPVELLVVDHAERPSGN